MAVARDLKRLAQLLSHWGAAANYRNHDGNAPFHMVLLRRRREMIDLLLSNGANLTLADARQCKSLDSCNSPRSRLIYWIC